MFRTIALVASLATGLADATTYNCTFTWYGAGDTRGSPNCNTNTAACGFYSYPGYSTAVSQNLYGAGPGQCAGPECGKCLKVNVYYDMNGNPIQNLDGAGSDVVLLVNNLCPAEGNPLCAQPNLQSTNQYGGTIDVNVCSDSGARQAIFGNSGTGLALGTAEEVDCSSWNGTIQHSGTSPSLASGTASSCDGSTGTSSNSQSTGQSSQGMLGQNESSDAEKVAVSVLSLLGLVIGLMVLL